MGGKVHIDKQVAATTGTPQKVVTTITTEFLVELMRHVVANGAVTITGFGTLHIVHRKSGGRPSHLKRIEKQKVVGEHKVIYDEQRVVVFKKGGLFKRLIQEKFGKATTENLMDKLGVDEEVNQEELEKKANAGCPVCGAKPEVHGKVLVCPTHGTEPFERAK